MSTKDVVFSPEIFRMSYFEILDAAIPEQLATWISLWQSWSAREISAHPEYARLFSRPCDRVVCASLNTDQGGVLFPLILRPLSTTSWGKDYGYCYDWTTPYGYGGPFTWGSIDAQFFWSAFDAWCMQNNIVCGFARLALFPEQLLPFVGEVETKAMNVVRTLDPNPDILWMDYEHKVRKNVNKARRNGIEICVDETGDRLQEFLSIYYATMERRQASVRYYFPVEFFQVLTEKLKGGFIFFHGLYQDKIVSTELVLVSVNYIYSFLGGTLADFFDFRPNDLLKHAIIEWGIAQHKKAFILGGGYEPQDGIFRYKLSFAPSGKIPFKIGKRIYNPTVYASLLQLRQEWEMAQGRLWIPDTGFFPAYRG
jgi:hypothetical protein